jgi:outer membrane lipoprotein-sorting protein
MSVKYVLKPKSKSDIDYCNIELFKSDAMVRRAAIALSDGTLIKIEVSSMKLTPVLPVEDFRPRSIFDSSWIVTDLR